MPLLRIDLYNGKTDEELVKILDTIHEAVVEAFEVPVSDRYQVVTQHEKNELAIEDTGLGYKRTNDLVLISITTSPRSVDMKQKFYELVVNKLHEKLSISKQDVMINITENTTADWSFGEGKAEYLTGDL